MMARNCGSGAVTNMGMKLSDAQSEPFISYYGQCLYFAIGVDTPTPNIPATILLKSDPNVIPMPDCQSCLYPYTFLRKCSDDSLTTLGMTVGNAVNYPGALKINSTGVCYYFDSSNSATVPSTILTPSLVTATTNCKTCQPNTPNCCYLNGCCYDIANTIIHGYVSVSAVSKNGGGTTVGQYTCSFNYDIPLIGCLYTTIVNSLIPAGISWISNISGSGSWPGYSGAVDFTDNSHWTLYFTPVYGKSGSSYQVQCQIGAISYGGYPQDYLLAAVAGDCINAPTNYPSTYSQTYTSTNNGTGITTTTTYHFSLTLQNNYCCKNRNSDTTCITQTRTERNTNGTCG
jgi:hypothetical protein